MDVISLSEIYAAFDNTGVLTTTYMCEVSGEILTPDKLAANETGVVKDVTWEELFNGSFGPYNVEIFNSLKNSEN